MDEWQKEHEKLYGSEAQHASKKAKFAALVRQDGGGRFPLTRVSSRAQELILDLEAAYAKMAASQTAVEVDAAYANLCHRRRDLYVHISDAEAYTNWPRTVALRFD